MGSLESDLDTASQWIAASLTASGYAADFSPSSLWEVDRFFDDQTAKGKPRSKGLLSSDLGARVFAIGAYTGEVIRRDVGGVWRTDDDDPAGEVNVELVLDEGTCIQPVRRVMSRLQDGAESGLAPYAAVLGVRVGPRPSTPSKRRLFRR